MNNNQSFIRHETLNALTLINYLMVSASMEESKKDEILSALKMVGFLVSKQEVLSGQKKTFAHHKIQLDEVLELIYLILEKEIKKRRICLSIYPDKLTVVGDITVIKEGLEHIFLNVMNLSKNIEVRLNQKERKLLIKYGSTKKIHLDKDDPIQCLKNKRSHSEFFFKTALHLMALNGIKTKFKEGLVEVSFPSDQA